MTYRLFAFWDTRKEMLVVVTHGIVKRYRKLRIRRLRKRKRL